MPRLKHREKGSIRKGLTSRKGFWRNTVQHEIPCPRQEAAEALLNLGVVAQNMLDVEAQAQSPPRSGEGISAESPPHGCEVILTESPPRSGEGISAESPPHSCEGILNESPPRSGEEISVKSPQPANHCEVRCSPMSSPWKCRNLVPSAHFSPLMCSPSSSTWIRSNEVSVKSGAHRSSATPTTSSRRTLFPSSEQTPTSSLLAPKTLNSKAQSSPLSGVSIVTPSRVSFCANTLSRQRYSGGGRRAPNAMTYLSYAAVSRSGEDRFKKFTGITPDQFDVLYEEILGNDELCKTLKYKQGQKTPKRAHSSLSPKERLFLTLVRLRKGWTIDDLAYLFGISIRAASDTIFTWINFMYHQMKRLQEPMFLSRSDQEYQSIPASFRPFKKVRVIIDTTEVRVQVPSNYEQQGNLYSDYKAGVVVLYLFGISAFGAISFISEGFEGNASDRQIFLESGIRDFLVPGDAVMMDRGFKVKDIADMDKFTVIEPPHLQGRDEFTVQEDLLTKQIAAARIIVENAIRRVKTFKLLKNLTNLLLPTLDQTVYVCGFLANFGLPVISSPLLL